MIKKDEAGIVMTVHDPRTVMNGSHSVVLNPNVLEVL